MYKIACYGHSRFDFTYNRVCAKKYKEEMVLAKRVRER